MRIDPSNKGENPAVNKKSGFKRKGLEGSEIINLIVPAVFKKLTQTFGPLKKGLYKFKNKKQGKQLPHAGDAYLIGCRTFRKRARTSGHVRGPDGEPPAKKRKT